MHDRALSRLDIPVPTDTVTLSPGLGAGVAVGSLVAEATPARIRTSRGGTKVGWWIHRAPVAAWAGAARWWRPWCLGSCSGPLLTGFTERLMEQSGAGLGGFRTAAAGGGLGVRGALGSRGDSLGHPPCTSRQSIPRATSRRWENNG